MLMSVNIVCVCDVMCISVWDVSNSYSVQHRSSVFVPAVPVASHSAARAKHPNGQHA